MDKGRSENNRKLIFKRTPLPRKTKNAILKDPLGNSRHPAAQFLEDTSLWPVTPCPESLPNAHASSYALVLN